MVIRWLDWVRRLQSIAQAGFTYNHDAYDQERYQQVQAIASEIASEHTSIDTTLITTLYQHEKGYATPKIDVRGVVFNEKGELLLVKEASTQKWTLPGGWADVWDTPSQAVEREIVEESGYVTKTIKLLAVYDRDTQGHPAYEFAVWKHYFLCDLIGGQAQTSVETSAIGWFAEDALPEIDTGRTLEKNLKRFFEHHRNPTLPTDFD
ncbi:MAG: NUDIX hydrolase N-terminal domain-containing protein [Chloroflexota bacterium]